MVKHRAPQNEVDERNKEIVLSFIRYMTFRHRDGVDLDKVNSITLARGIGMSLEDAKKFVQVLISEGKIEKVQ